MDGGKLMQVGSADELYNRPDNLFVAGFIGSPPMNLIDCTFVERDGSPYLDAGIFKLCVPPAIRRIVASTKGSELTLGIRPEDISIHKKRVQNSVEADVYISEPLGSEVIVTLEVQDNLLKTRAPPAFQAIAGEKVWMTFNEDKIHIFDKKSERAIV